MSSARVESIDALKELRNAIWKFAEAADQSLSEANADLERMLNWLEHEAHFHWQGQIRQRRLDLNQARESLRSKQAVTCPDGSKPRVVEEEQAVALAESRLQRAEQKLETVKQYAKAFQRETVQYRGSMQRFVTDVRVDVPEAVAHLDGLIGSLTQYVSPEEVGSAAPAGGPQQAAASVKRPVEPGPDTPTANPEVPPVPRSVRQETDGSNEGPATADAELADGPTSDENASNAPEKE